MVRLPDTGPIEWQEHTHTSGRIFLSNPATNETRWLWRKWDSNGRIFVENITNPSQTLWCDQMDLAMRLQSGIATQQEVHNFQMFGLHPPPPPPPPPTSSNQFFDQQSNAYQPPHLQQPNQQHINRPPFPLRSHPSPNRDHNSFRHQPPLFQNQHPSNSHDRFPNHDYKSNPEQQQDKFSRKRADSFNGSGRYWADHQEKHKNSKKRPKLDKKLSNKQGKKPYSRFESQFDDDILDISPSRLVRPLPVLPTKEELEQFNLSKRPSLVPRTKLAQQFVNCSSAQYDKPLVAYLYRKDWGISRDQKDTHSEATFADDIEEEYNFEPVIGTSQNIEKEYLRLTSAPKPEAVRPPAILKQAVEHIKQSWKDSRKDYDWVCKQLKSVRQDYKVQHIDNADVVHAYETHARIALENSDLGEFNTCVAQLQELFHKVDVAKRTKDEFSAYRILYNLLVGASEREQGKILTNFSPRERNRKATKYALQIRKAIITGNYIKYFQLCVKPPSKTMISYLLIHFHARVRSRGIAAMAAAYGPGQPATLPLSFVFGQLNWSLESCTEGDRSDDKVRLEDIIPSEEIQLLKSMRSLNLSKQSVWIFKAIAFLFSINCVLMTDRDDSSSTLDRVKLDFKASKAAGIKQITSAKKLITHAGSAIEKSHV